MLLKGVHNLLLMRVLYEYLQMCQGSEVIKSPVRNRWQVVTMKWPVEETGNQCKNTALLLWAFDNIRKSYKIL